MDAGRPFTMTMKRFLGHRTKRTGLWAKCKWTNQTLYDPFDLEADRVYFQKYWDEVQKSKGNLLVKAEPVHPKFIMPLAVHDIRKTLARVPAEFSEGLQAVFLLGGSNKQFKSSRLYRYGVYWLNMIFIHPYPRYFMTEYWGSPPAPHVQREYRRAGAQCSRSGGGWKVAFTKESLKEFYIRDVLIHELGHHVDGHTSTNRQSERFAEWFVTEYGYKRPDNEGERA